MAGLHIDPGVLLPPPVERQSHDVLRRNSSLEKRHAKFYGGDENKDLSDEDVYVDHRRTRYNLGPKGRQSTRIFNALYNDIAYGLVLLVRGEINCS